MSTFAPTPITYSQLLAKVQSETENQSTEFAAQFPEILKDAELMLLRPLDLLQDRVYADSNFGASTTTSDNAKLPVPNDLVVIRNFSYFTPAFSDASNGKRIQLERRSETFIDEYWPTRSDTGLPKYYTQLAYNQVLVAPTPDGPYNVEMAYTSRPMPMSSSNPTTYLSTWFPDALFLACMVRSYAFMKDPEMQQVYQQMLSDALKNAVIEEARRKAEDYSDQSATEPPDKKA